MLFFDSNRYHIESSISSQDNFSVMPLCFVNQTLLSLPTEEPSTECEKEPGSLLWIFVMVGNIVRGMGETPIMPLGISYLEDFAKAENSPFYLDFIPFLNALFRNPVYMLFICITVLQFNAFNGMISFMPKYLEQQFGKSASDAIFLIGVYNLPVICIGYFFGGLLMKKFKMNIYQAANIAFWASLLEYLLYFAAYWTVCDTSPVAGLTVSYKG
ncbi:hypothetical protein Q9233_002530 [Columba guinea]|nr:hypothetical protein Q9233_002530 [Columba guinea]